MAELYNHANGASLGKIDPGDGVRQKSWTEELSRMLLEASQPSALGVSSSFPMSNYPEFLDGEGKAGFSGVTLYSASPVRRIATAGVGDGSGTPYALSGSTAFGEVLRGATKVVGTVTGVVYATDDADLGATGAFVATAGVSPALTAGTVTFATGVTAAVAFASDPGEAIEFQSRSLTTIVLSDPVRVTPKSTRDYVLALK